MVNFNLDLTTTNLLEQVDEMDIFQYYWRSYFELKKNYSSPLREDNKPSFNVFPASFGTNKYLWKDFATGESGNCIQLVARLNRVDYNAALLNINRQFDANLDESTILKFIDEKHKLAQVSKNSLILSSDAISTRPLTEINVLFDRWTNYNYAFWKKYYIPIEYLTHFNIYPIKGFSINNRPYVYPKLGYCYIFKENDYIHYKIYQPNSTTYKWISNTNSSIIEGYEQLQFDNKIYRTVILTKSLKDVVCLRVLGFAAVSPQSESTLITQDFMNKIKRYAENIVLFFDNDKVGIEKSTNIANQFNLRSIYLDDCKDISDYIVKYGILQATIKINNLIYGNV